MISIRCSALMVLLALASTAVANHELSACPGRTCPEQNFMFTCTGQGGELTWVIVNADNVQVTNYTVDSELSAGENDTFGDQNQFMVQKVNNNSTRLWFRANPNYNSYSVVCVDDEDNEMSCNNLQVFGPPMPENFIIDTRILSRTSVRLNWAVPPSYKCMISYYNIWVNGLSYNVSGNYTWYDLPVTFGIEYCPVIIAHDAAMRPGPQVQSTPRCIDVDVPPAVILNNNMYDYRAGDFVNITVSWVLPITNTPLITNYTVRYNETYRNDMGSGSGSDDDDNNMREMLVPASQTSVMLRGSFRVRSTYFVEVIPSNIFGAGTVARNVFTIPTQTMSPTPTPTTMPPSGGGGLSTGAIIGIVVGSIVGLILIVVIVVVIIVVIVMVAGRGGKGNKAHELTKL